MTSRLLFIPLLFVAFTAPVLASGTVSQPSMPRTASTSNADAHERGRADYTRKVACASCAVPGGATDAASAKQIVMRIDAGEFDLSRAERRRIKAFLAHRFAL